MIDSAVLYTGSAFNNMSIYLAHPLGADAEAVSSLRSSCQPCHSIKAKACDCTQANSLPPQPKFLTSPNAAFPLRLADSHYRLSKTRRHINDRCDRSPMLGRTHRPRIQPPINPRRPLQPGSMRLQTRGERKRDPPPNRTVTLHRPLRINGRRINLPRRGVGKNTRVRRAAVLPPIVAHLARRSRVR